MIYIDLQGFSTIQTVVGNGISEPSNLVVGADFNPTLDDCKDREVSGAKTSSGSSKGGRGWSRNLGMLGTCVCREQPVGFPKISQGKSMAQQIGHLFLDFRTVFFRRCWFFRFHKNHRLSLCIPKRLMIWSSNASIRAIFLYRYIKLPPTNRQRRITNLTFSQ